VAYQAKKLASFEKVSVQPEPSYQVPCALTAFYFAITRVLRLAKPTKPVIAWGFWCQSDLLPLDAQCGASPGVIEGTAHGRLPHRRVRHRHGGIWLAIGIPLCRALGGGLWEMRSSLTQGRIARVIFRASAGHMVP